MTDWQLTAGLQNLRAQVDAAFPDRDHTSDGTIGDTAHQAETSGHNPDDTAGARPEWDGDPDSIPEVRAWDMDSDLRCAGVTAQDLVDHIRRLPGLSSVVRYMIYDRRLYHVRDGFAPTAYTGSSPHTEHIHFDGAWSQAADGNTTFDYRLHELRGDDTMLVSKGDSSDQVRFWQYVLTELGFGPGDIDGDYGAKTEAAVNAYRASKRVGPSTSINSWTAFVLLRDLAVHSASGKTGPQGPAGPQGPKGDPGPAGPAGQVTGTFTVTGGQLTARAGS